MIERRVWAPTAERVELVVDRERRDMLRELGGWWRGAWEDLAPGTDYSFALDGGDPLPDPRAAQLPNGVHGPARVVDHAAYQWPATESGWQPPSLAGAVIYELHIGTFSPEGTFDGAAARLGHVADLGATHVEVMPVHSFPGTRGWGYDGVGLFAPHEPYGGPDGLRRFVAEAHRLGLAVLLDVVYNHLGPDGNYLPRFGPYLTNRHATPWGPAINLDDAGSHEVRRFLADNAIMWLRDYRVDGLRLDAADTLVDQSAIHVLEQLATEVAAVGEREGRPFVLVAESDLNDPRLVRPVELGGYGLDAAWSDDVHHAIHTALTGERTGYYADFGGIPDLVKALRDSYVYDGRFSKARQRRHGRPATGVDPGRFVAFAQNHDQVGNRARGERLSHLVGADALRVAAALVLAGPFVPLLFMGEEWAASTPFLYFTDHNDPELVEAVLSGRRGAFAAFGWAPEDVPDPQDPGTFAASRLAWNEVGQAPHADVLAWHRELIELRRRHPGLRDGRRPEIVWRRGDDAFLVERAGVTVAYNLGAVAATLELRRGETDVLASSSAIGRPDGGTFALPAMSVAMLAAPDAALV
ncbi:MAG TPA: malto-oligosyltrehalose trehalohydrolase [Clostridia bacterium]|nr:malto-oligosyltrehalose trehalohydrolase [Clostridia bacterium]